MQHERPVRRRHEAERKFWEFAIGLLAVGALAQDTIPNVTETASGPIYNQTHVTPNLTNTGPTYNQVHVTPTGSNSLNSLVTTTAITVSNIPAPEPDTYQLQP